MNLSRFIALRIYRNSEPGKQVSRPAVLIAMVGIALGLAVMIIAVSVDRKSTRLNSSHSRKSRMPSSA